MNKEQGNRRTDEQGTLNAEVPERYARTVFYTRARYAQDAKTLRKPQNGIFFMKHALERSEKIIFRRKIGEAGS